MAILKIIIGLFIYWLIPTTVEKISDLKFKYEQWLYKRTGKTRARTVSFNKVKKRHKKKKTKRDKFIKKHPILSVFVELYEFLIRILWYRVPDYPYDIRLWVKTKYQRAKKGWAVSDAWGFHYYLAKVIKEGSTWLKKNKHGIPSKCYNPAVEKRKNKIKKYTEEKAFIKGERKWEDILFDIIWTFEVAEKIDNHTWFYPHHKNYFTKKELKIYKKLAKEFQEEWPKDDYHVMTPEECEQYRKGWQLFQEYFFDLWD